jgi:hypothetical protein
LPLLLLLLLLLLMMMMIMMTKMNPIYATCLESSGNEGVPQIWVPR